MPSLTVRADRPVDPDLLAILRQTHAAARELEIDYFVGGALARDLILLHVYGMDTGRATRDVDIGIHIAAWETLASLKANLIRSGKFSEAAGTAHRLIYGSQDHAFGIPLDLLPFGGVERANATIAWLPDTAVVMSVAGFAEARASAQIVEVSESLRVPVASLPALAVLKLVAWRDRRLETSKDATDFLLIARHYHEAGNVDRLYDAESALLVATDYDPELAGAMLLGNDVAAICSIATARIVTDIIAGDQLPQRLIDQLMSVCLSDARDVASTRVALILDAFRRGLELVWISR